MKSKLLLLLFLVTRSALATHLLGGYIQVQQTLTTAQQYTIRVIVFMDEANGQVAGQQTSTVQVCFGDGSSGAAQRTERALLPGKPNVSRNVYTTGHTYAGPGTYTALCLIANRTDGLTNIPSSGIPFGLSTTFSTNQTNTTPTLSFSDSDTAYVFQKLTLQVRTTDAEGDSLY